MVISAGSGRCDWGELFGWVLFDAVVAPHNPDCMLRRTNVNRFSLPGIWDRSLEKLKSPLFF
jgi:hypothetical protein